MKPTSIQNMNTCSNLNSCDDLFSKLFYGEQADALKKPHDTLADSESNQDTIGEAEDEANIVKKCVACFSFDYCDVSFLVCPMVDRLMLIDMYTTVYITNTTSVAMYVYACYCYEDTNYYACLATATVYLGSVRARCHRHRLLQADQDGHHRVYGGGEEERGRNEEALDVKFFNLKYYVINF